MMWILTGDGDGTMWWVCVEGGIDDVVNDVDSAGL